MPIALCSCSKSSRLEDWKRFSSLSMFSSLLISCAIPSVMSFKAMGISRIRMSRRFPPMTMWVSDVFSSPLSKASLARSGPSGVLDDFDLRDVPLISFCSFKIVSLSLSSALINASLTQMSSCFSLRSQHGKGTLFMASV